MQFLIKTFVIFTISFCAVCQPVTDAVNMIYSGKLTFPEMKLLFKKLEEGMPYPSLIDNARVLTAKCWFASPSSKIELETLKNQIKTALLAADAADSLELKIDLKNCEAFNEYANGNYSRAIDVLNLAMDNSPTTPEFLDVTASSHLILSRIYYAKGEYEKAFSEVEQAHELYTLAGNEYESALALKEIALIHADLKNFSLAIEQLERAVEILNSFNIQEYYKAVDDLAKIYELAGEKSKALSLYLEIQDSVTRFEDLEGQSYLDLKIAELQIQLGQLASAQYSLEKVQNFNLTNSKYQSIFLLTKAEWQLANGLTSEARKLYDLMTSNGIDTWSANNIERFLYFQQMLAAQLNNPNLEVDALRKLLVIAKQKSLDIANDKLLSQRLSFDIEQRGKEIARLQEINEVKGKLLSSEEAKGLWQRTALIFSSILIIILIVFAYRQLINKHRFKTLALKDELTGAANRRAILEFKREVFNKNANSKDVCSLISIDIDHFKTVNDIYGHDVGDQLLVSIVNSMEENIRKNDKLGRVGGEEFLVVLPYTNLRTANEIAERIRGSVETIDHTTRNINATVSVGVVEVIQGETPSQAGVRVDKNLYTAKNNGRNRVVAI